MEPTAHLLVVLGGLQHRAAVRQAVHLALEVVCILRQVSMAHSAGHAGVLRALGCRSPDPTCAGKDTCAGTHEHGALMQMLVPMRTMWARPGASPPTFMIESV